MANMRRERKSVDFKARQGARLEGATREGLRAAAMETAREIAVPLREALQIVRVLSLVEKPRTDDGEAIAFIAAEAAHRLHYVSDTLDGLFTACRPDA